MSQLNKEITETDVPETPVDDSFFQPSDKEQEVVSRVFNLFDQTSDERNFGFEYFDGRNIIEYIEDSVKRFVTNVDERGDIENWQARVHVPFTRNKVLAILGKVVDALPVASFMPRGSEDQLRADILNSLFQYSEDVDNSQELFTYAIEEALVKGTMVGYEGYREKERKVRNVKKYNQGDEITVKEGKKVERKVVTDIVPLEEFYPSHVGHRSIEDMPYCFWRKTIPYRKFLEQFSDYEKAKKVQPFESHHGDKDEQTPFYRDYISQDVGDGNVEVIRYYNKDTDEYVIIANGIWLNPMEDEVVSPIPFNHKDLPFWSIRYDLHGSDFFYGKSLPDRIKQLQDVLNVLTNMLLDQSFLTIFPPILASGIDDIEDDFLVPGRRISVDTQGLPLQDSYQTLDMGTPSGWHQFILEYTKGIMEESSIDSVQQGVAGVGERTTATEIRSAAAGVTSLLGLFAKFIKDGMKRRARLRAQNILQFYTNPQKPIIEHIGGVGASKSASKAFNVFQVDSSPMTPGSRGTKIIEMFAAKSQLPTKKELDAKSKLEQKTSNKKVQRIAVTPEYIRNIDFDVRLAANPKSEASQELERALEIQFQQTFLSLHGDLANRKELAAQLAKKFGRDPSKVINEQVIEQQLQPEQGSQEGQSLVPNQSGENSESTVRGGTGVGGEGQSMKNLMQSMQG